MSEPSWLLVGHQLKGSKYLESVRNLLDSLNFFYFEGTIGDWGANNNYRVTRHSVVSYQHDRAHCGSAESDHGL